MTDTSNQKRLAASILKCGENRIWINPDELEQVAGAITREDVRGLIEDGIIRRNQAKGVSRGRARKRNQKRRVGRRTGQGSRKGTLHARLPKKRRWIRKIRSQRKVLRELRGEKKISVSDYRRLYRKSKGGEFRSKAHLLTVTSQLGKKRKSKQKKGGRAK
jgi:large subunit ribosomal protein L19e